MVVFVTGGSGFVGKAVIDELLTRGHEVRALGRGGKTKPASPKMSVVQGDLLKPNSYAAALRTCDAVIHLVGIIVEKPSRGITFERIHVDGTRALVSAIAQGGPRRYLHMSALGTRAGADTEYHRTKFAAEQIVRESQLEWTLFRPSLIHGAGGEFMRMEAMWVRGRAPAPVFFMPFIPYFGGGLFGQKGAGLLQPVFVKDVARAFVDALEIEQTKGEIYPMGGTETFTWPQLHRTIAIEILGKPRRTLALPVWLAKSLAAAGLGRLLGFNRDQVIMSQEDSVTDLAKFARDFGWTPRGLTETLPGYAKDL